MSDQALDNLSMAQAGLSFDRVCQSTQATASSLYSLAKETRAMPMPLPIYNFKWIALTPYDC